MTRSAPIRIANSHSPSMSFTLRHDLIPMDVPAFPEQCMSDTEADLASWSEIACSST